MTIKKPLVLGFGGVGKMVSILLNDLTMNVTAFDVVRPTDLPEGLAFIEGNAKENNHLTELFQNYDAVISCLPYFLTLKVAKAAHKASVHYFDLTEDVATTDEVIKLAKDAKAVMIPQNGLAPGFIGIAGADLAGQFDDGTLESIRLRVGALPQHPIGQLGYAGNWSLAGLIHEYIAECWVIADGTRKKISALRNAEILRIDGAEYEAFTTSGGLGTMTETYQGKVKELNYKSIRYPGHLSGMKLLIEELNFKDDEAALVEKIAKALPPDDQDRVLIHASVKGEIEGKLQTKEWVADYKPIEIAGQTRTSIVWTTAASIVAVIEMVSEGSISQKGFVRQEDISLEAFLNTKTGSLYKTHNDKMYP